MAWVDRPAVRRSRSDVPSGTGPWPDAKRGRMKTRYLLAGLTALGASITMVAQQGAPNEGRTLQGPALRIERKRRVCARWRASPDPRPLRAKPGGETESSCSLD